MSAKRPSRLFQLVSAVLMLAIVATAAAVVLFREAPGETASVVGETWGFIIHFGGPAAICLAMFAAMVCAIVSLVKHVKEDQA